jgi:hypothetical protein
MRRRTDADSWRQQIDEATADVSLGELPAHLNIAQQSHVLLGIASARESARRARTAIPGAGGR